MRNRGLTLALVLILACESRVVGAGEDEHQSEWREPGPSVEILDPLDGDRGLPHSFEFHYVAHRGGQVSCFIDGRNVYTSTATEERLNIPYLPLGFHTLEVQLTADDGGAGGGEVLGFDMVDVFVLGDGQMAPEGLDDDAQVEAKLDADKITEAIDEALRRGQTRQRETQEAEAELERVVTVLGNAPGPLVPRAYYALAQVLLARGDVEGIERAIAALREAIWHTPAHGESHHLLAVLLTEQERAFGRPGHARSETNQEPLRRGDETQLARAHARAARRLLPTAPAALPPAARVAVRTLSDGAPGGGAGPLLKVGLMTVGSGRYAAFAQANTASAEAYLLRGVAELHYYIFTDQVAQVEAQYRGGVPWAQGRVHVIFREHDGWPSASMKRFLCDDVY